MTTLENKKKWIPEVVKEGWLAIFGHDAKNPAAYRSRARWQLVEPEPAKVD